MKYAMLCLIMFFVLVGVGVNGLANESLPWFVNDDVLFELVSVTEEDAKERELETSICTDPSELEYILYTEGGTCLYDSEERAVIVGEKMLYLCKKERGKAIIQQGLRQNRIKDRYASGRSSYYFSDQFGNGILFNSAVDRWTTELSWFDWIEQKIYTFGVLNTHCPSSDGGYRVCVIDGDVWVFDLINAQIYRTETYGQKSIVNGIYRITDNGGVLYKDGKPQSYLSFSDMKIYGTNLPESSVYVGDDFYFNNAAYSLERVYDSGKKTMYKKIDEPALARDDVYFGMAGNAFWYAAPLYSGKVFLCEDTMAEGGNAGVIEGDPAIDPRKRYSEFNFTNSSIFSNWHIIDMSTNQYIHSDKAAISLMNTNYSFCDTSYGYIATQADDPLVDGKVYKSLTSNGYVVYNFKNNKATKVPVVISE